MNINCADLTCIWLEDSVPNRPVRSTENEQCGWRSSGAITVIFDGYFCFSSNSERTTNEWISDELRGSQVLFRALLDGHNSLLMRCAVLLKRHVIGSKSENLIASLQICDVGHAGRYEPT